MDRGLDCAGGDDLRPRGQWWDSAGLVDAYAFAVAPGALAAEVRAWLRLAIGCNGDKERPEPRPKPGRMHDIRLIRSLINQVF